MSHHYSPPERPLTHRMTPDGTPLPIDEYERAGGYEAVRVGLRQHAPEAITAMVKESGLRGRGGAGFPTGTKWGLTLADDDPRPRYIVANGDEMEPGTFKDRMLMERDPHQLIEGMILAGYAIGARVGYIFVRGEYVEARRRLATAIAEATARGHLGRDIHGSGFDFALHLHVSAGRYICGEETALISALEGRRAVPRAKPPFPGQSGLFGRPTVVNNVETLCNVPHIVLYGADWFRGLSRSKDGGTKLYGVSGKVRHPGCWELPMGTTAREIVEEHAGGMREGLRLKAWLPGGASTDFLLPEHLDLPMDYDSIAAAGSRMGTGNIMVFDHTVDMLGALRNLEHFFAQESCGWCTPCRDGLPWVEGALARLAEGRAAAGDLQFLREAPTLLGPGRTFCAHAPGAMEPLASAMRHWPELFRAAGDPA